MKAMDLFTGVLNSPVGELTLAWDDEEALRALEFDGHEDRLQTLMKAQYREVRLHSRPLPAEFRTALDAYFTGDFGPIDKLRVQTAGTPFQQHVWAALREIPAGTTMSYGQLAAKLGKPAGASRAVGGANGANPVGIVVPCHRVIGADGSLTGYGGGVERKRWLLDHERAHLFQLTG